MKHRSTTSFSATLFLAATMLLSSCVTSAPQVEKWAPERRAQAHVELGLIYLRENQFDTAEVEFKQALQTAPGFGKAHHSMGLLLARKGRDAAATPFFAKAVKLEPDNFLSVNDYAVHLCQQGDGKSGLELLKAIEHNPENNKLSGTQLGLGICYFDLKRDKLAATYLRTVLNQFPLIVPALYRMGEISYRQKSYLSARAFVERYFATGAISERALFLGAKVEVKLGDLNRADEYRKELEKHYPGSSLNKNLQSVASG